MIACTPMKMKPTAFACPSLKSVDSFPTKPRSNSDGESHCQEEANHTTTKKKSINNTESREDDHDGCDLDVELFEFLIGSFIHMFPEPNIREVGRRRAVPHPPGRMDARGTYCRQKALLDSVLSSCGCCCLDLEPHTTATYISFFFDSSSTVFQVGSIKAHVRHYTFMDNSCEYEWLQEGIVLWIVHVQ